MTKNLSILFLFAAIVLNSCSQKIESSSPQIELKSTTLKAFACKEYTATNYQHVQSGRAVTYQYNLYAKTVGAGHDLGMVGTAYYSTTTTVKETAAGYFEKGSCPAADTVAPVLTITAPADGATVGGNVNFTSTSSDNIGVVKVTYTALPGAVLCSSTTAPFSCTWDSRYVAGEPLANGSALTITAVAADAAGNEGYSTIHITVDQTDTIAPTINLTGPAHNSFVSGSVTLTSVSSDNVGVVRVVYVTDPGATLCESTQSPFDCIFSTSSFQDGTYFNMNAVAFDAAGNHAHAPQIVTFTVDNTKPAGTITYPANGATVSGIITMTADITDNLSGISRVAYTYGFLGATAICDLTQAPYSCQFDTRTFPNGMIDVRTQIWDKAGNVGYSKDITFTISNAPVCQQYTAANTAHVSAGRAVKCGLMNMYACAKGSNDNLGLNNAYTSSTVKTSDNGATYKKGSCN